MFSAARISPSNSNSNAVEDAKKTIDLVTDARSPYITKSRPAGICWITVCCSPCFIYSTVMRIISCPIQCVCNSKIKCNPLAACLVDSCATSSSDNCIAVACTEVNKKHAVSRCRTKDENMEIIKYAAAKILATSDIKVRYAITDVVAPVIRSLAFLKEPTPALVLELAGESLAVAMPQVA